MNNTINVLQYIAYFPPHIGGYESHAAQRAKQWCKHGYGKCVVATYSIGQPDRTTYEKDGYTVVVIPAFEIIPTFPFPKFWTSQYAEAHKILKGYDSDIIITRTRFFWSSCMGGVYARLRSKKRIHIEHGVDYVKLTSKVAERIAWLYDQTLGRLVFRMSDAVIGISQGCKRFAQQFTSKTIPVLYRGIEFTPNPSNERVHGIVRILFVGRLTALKGVDILLQSLRRLLDIGTTNRRCTIIGDGEHRQYLENLSQSLDLQQYVIFEGYKNKKFLETIAYPNADICVNASYQEGLPMSVVEPLIAGCVVVATAVGGTPEISNTKDLILVEPGNYISLTQGLSKAISLYDKVAGISKDAVRHKFNWDATIKEYYTFIRLLVS